MRNSEISESTCIESRSDVLEIWLCSSVLFCSSVALFSGPFTLFSAIDLDLFFLSILSSILVTLGTFPFSILGSPYSSLSVLCCSFLLFLSGSLFSPTAAAVSGVMFFCLSLFSFAAFAVPSIALSSWPGWNSVPPFPLPVLLPR